MDEVIYPSYSDPRNPAFQTIFIDPTDGLPVSTDPPTPTPTPAPAAGGLLDTLMGTDGTRILGFTPVVALGIAGAALYFLNSKN